MTTRQRAELADALELSGGRSQIPCGTHKVPPVPPPRPPPPPPSPPSPSPSPPSPPGPPLPVVGPAGCWDTHGLAAPVLLHQCRERGWKPTGNNLNATIEGCAQCCASQLGIAFIGLGGCIDDKCGTQCACLSRLPPSGAVSEAQCDVPCPGNRTERCGGDWKYQLYNVTRSVHSSRRYWPAVLTWFVDPHTGSDSNSGTKAEPFKSIEAAIAVSRKHQGARTIQLRAGVYYDTALDFTEVDGGLTVASFDGPGSALLTGGTQLTGTWSLMTLAEQQRRFPAVSNKSSVVQMHLSDVLPPGMEVEGLQLIDASAGGSLKLSRATRARFPNVQSIETNLYPDGWIVGKAGVHWVGRTFTDKSTVRFKNFSRTQFTPLYGALRPFLQCFMVQTFVINFSHCGIAGAMTI